MKYAAHKSLTRRALRKATYKDYELLKVPRRSAPGAATRLQISIRATDIRERRHRATILAMDAVKRDMAAESMKKELQYQRELVQSIADNEWRNDG